MADPAMTMPALRSSLHSASPAGAEATRAGGICAASTAATR